MACLIIRATVRTTIRALAVLLAGCAAAAAQDLGTLDPKPLPPLAKPDDPNTAAKDLFGRKPTPAALEARAIGYYTGGCLAGGVALPINGKTWQVMRISRNRNWGHPNLVKSLERFSEKAPTIGWRTACWSATWRSRAAARCSPAIGAIRSGSMPTSGSRRCRSAS